MEAKNLVLGTTIATIIALTFCGLVYASGVQLTIYSTNISVGPGIQQVIFPIYINISGDTLGTGDILVKFNNTILKFDSVVFSDCVNTGQSMLLPDNKTYYLSIACMNKSGNILVANLRFNITPGYYGIVSNVGLESPPGSPTFSNNAGNASYKPSFINGTLQIPNVQITVYTKNISITSGIQNVTFPIYINISGDTLGTGDILVKFNSTILKFDSVVFSDCANTGQSMLLPDNKTYYLSIVCANKGGNILVANLRFNITPGYYGIVSNVGLESPPDRRFFSNNAITATYFPSFINGSLQINCTKFDFNIDGLVDIFDVVAALEYLSKNIQIYNTACSDVNNNERIDLMDLFAIIEKNINIVE